jgi:2-keto-4-pentenoate hydratase/2-oxohepta-3-ene-1,7-dioic acid hydratase in catechol pathway
MKFATWIVNNTEEAGILSADMKSVHSFECLGLDYASLLNFIVRRTERDMALLREKAGTAGRSINGVSLEAPIPKPHHDIICLGLNYMDHAKESASFDINTDAEREAAVYFSKRVIRALGPGGTIINHFDVNERLDYEAEMAIVIGKEASGVRREDAWDYIFGVCCFNDISGRDLQVKHKQWYFGKSLDTFTAFGPYIVTLDEFVLPLALNISSRINGEIRQNSNTRYLLFPPDHIIAELSAGMTLDPGTIIATGTPAGVGAGFKPRHKCMQSGETCEIEIEGCGVLRNTVG